MLKKTLVAAVAACALAAGAVAATTPADAAARFSVHVGPTFAPPSGPRECWQWSNRADDWVWTCRHFSRHGRDYGPYAYNQPSFSFSFGDFGGDRHHRRMH